MTGLMLQDALVEFLTIFLKGYSLKAKTGEIRPVKVYRQWLPQPKSLSVQEEIPDNSIEVVTHENELSPSENMESEPVQPGEYNEAELEDYFPCVIVKLDNCIDGADTVSLGATLLIGVYDTGLDNQGYVDALNLVEAIRLELLSLIFLDDRFRLDMPLEYSMDDNQPWPVYFGILKTKWETRRVNKPSASLVNYGGGYIGKKD